VNEFFFIDNVANFPLLLIC